MVHAFQLLFVDCNYPKAFVWWIGMHAVMFFFLFREFYRQSYGSRKVNIQMHKLFLISIAQNLTFTMFLDDKK
jgi:hypothetical protein